MSKNLRSHLCMAEFKDELIGVLFKGLGGSCPQIVTTILNQSQV